MFWLPCHKVDQIKHWLHLSLRLPVFVLHFSLELKLWIEKHTAMKHLSFHNTFLSHLSPDGENLLKNRSYTLCTLTAVPWAAFWHQIHFSRKHFSNCFPWGNISWVSFYQLNSLCWFYQSEAFIFSFGHEIWKRTASTLWDILIKKNCAYHVSSWGIAIIKSILLLS